MSKPRIKVFVSMKCGPIGWYDASEWKRGFMFYPLSAYWGQPKRNQVRVPSSDGWMVR